MCLPGNDVHVEDHPVGRDTWIEVAVKVQVVALSVDVATYQHSILACSSVHMKHYYTVSQILFLLRAGHFFHNIHASRGIMEVLKTIMPQFVSSSETVAL